MSREQIRIAPAQTPTPRLAFRPSEISKMLGIPRSTCYELIRRGELRSIRLGSPHHGILLVPADELGRLLKAAAAPQDRKAMN
jgi:excisionase family DNA binding protein